MKNMLAGGLLIFIALVILAVQTAGRRWLALAIAGIAVLVLVFALHVAAHALSL